MAPRGNSFDYTTNRHEITVYYTTDIILCFFAPGIRDKQHIVLICALTCMPAWVHEHTIRLAKTFLQLDLEL